MHEFYCIYVSYDQIIIYLNNISETVMVDYMVKSICVKL